MIGAVVTSFNDGFKINEWRTHYDEMKSVIDKYVIVDNGSSDAEYVKKVKETFPEAVVIELNENKGTTGAYNEGIAYLLHETNVNYIMLIGNDIKITEESINKLKLFLDENDDVGMVAPTLLKKDSLIVECDGCSIDESDYTMIWLNSNLPYAEISHKPHVVDTVAGGMNVAKRFFYEKVGLQDEKLFMYSDEIDMGIRSRKSGVKMAVVSDACAWHQHINPKNTILRHPYSAYLMARNKMYLARKHGTTSAAFVTLVKCVVVSSLVGVKAFLQFNFEKVRSIRWRIIGAFYGFKGDMRKNKYSSLDG